MAACMLIHDSTCIRLYDTAIILGKLQEQFKVAIDPQEYARDNLKFGLVEVVYEWAKVLVYAKKDSPCSASSQKANVA